VSHANTGAAKSKFGVLLIVPAVPTYTTHWILFLTEFSDTTVVGHRNRFAKLRSDQRHSARDSDRKAAVTTTIRFRFDGRSTAYQRSLRSQWRYAGRWPASRSHTGLLFTALVICRTVLRDLSVWLFAGQCKSIADPRIIYFWNQSGDEFD